MPTYSDATAKIDPIVQELMEDFYPDLVEAEVTIGGLFAHAILDESGEPKSPAIMQGGRPVLFKVKVNSEADRLEGKPDATITIDWDEWKARTIDSDDRDVIRAGLDEMLYSLEVRREKGTRAILTDDHGRPKLKIRRPDWTFSGFRAIAERHKASSYEVIQARELHDSYGNILFAFAADLADDGEANLPGVDVADRPRRKRGAAAVAASRR